jgi:5'-3' exonuclease
MLLLIDSASLWYRAYYGMPDTLLSPNGEPINAIRGYLDMVARLIVQYKPQRIVAAIEGDWRPTWRTELFPGYKANRVDDEGDEEEPDLLTPQIPILLDVLDAFNIPIVGADDYEADDVIATYSKREKGPIRIVTGDRDLFQLVDKKRDVKVVYLAKGISNHDLVDEKWIANKYGIPGERYALFSMIRGDVSDGLPGIKGIGEKGAAEIANNFAHINDVLAANEKGSAELAEKYRKKITESIDYAKIMEKLVMCAVDVPVPNVPDKLHKSNSLSFDLLELREKYGLGTSIDRFHTALSNL